MTLVEKPDPRKKLILAALLDAMIIGLGAAIFFVSGSVLYLLLSILIGAGISAPLMISALRELKEQKDASR